MLRTLLIVPVLSTLLMLPSCGGPAPAPETSSTPEFQWEVDQFADLRVLRYRIPGWDQLSLQEKQLCYYLVMSGLAGRDVMWDQNYRHNLPIRRAMEKVVEARTDADQGPEWDAFMLWAKQVWFANGIHHHYSNAKFTPGFPRPWFEERMRAAGASLTEEQLAAIFDPTVDPVKVSQDADRDLLLASAVNFYGPDVTQAEAKAFYAARTATKDPEPISHGLNSRLERGSDGRLFENVWRVGGLYGPALERVVYWLEKARGVALNPQQEKAIGLLIDYFHTGDLKTWDDFNIAWVQDTSSTVDFIHGFVEVYNDPLGMRGSYETIVQVRDPEASDRMAVLMELAPWFEQNSPILPQHKRTDVVGITYNFINVVGEAGDASPSTPVGVNLPNANWIRAKHGSKSVSLGNISEAYEKASGDEMMKEFAWDDAERARAKEHGALAGKLHTALHEVIGHASGVLEPGKDPKMLDNYASPLEEARADLVALYYIMDPKLVEVGLMPSLEVGKAQYEAYLRNGLMLQLRRLKLGDDVQQAHMRNRQMVSRWVLERGAPKGIVVLEEREGRRYVRINDYEGLRRLFGELLREVQRIKSQGDHAAGKALIETYGVKVDQGLHAEVLRRSEHVRTAPYSGFVNPYLVPVEDASGTITDIRIEDPKDFVEQMLRYGREHSFLP
jgi:dipeptidyl-peptidase-3